MTDMEPAEMTPRDPEAERAHRVRRRRLRVVAVIAAGVVAALVIVQLAFGWVGRVVDATGLTCGGGWDRIEGDELASLQVIRWGTPEAREQGFDPDDVADMPAGLAQPTLTTASTLAEDVYDPILYPLGDGVVLQANGYFDRTWVAADARTGEPLWGISESLEGSGFSTLHGSFILVSQREDGRTDLTSFDPRTGEKRSCARLPGRLASVTEVGDRDIAVAVARELDDGTDNTGTTVIRLDPETGRLAWSVDVDIQAAQLSSDGRTVTVSSTKPQALVEQGPGGDDVAALTLDAETGQEVWRLEQGGEGRAVMTALSLPDDSGATLVMERTGSGDADGVPVDYVLLDADGNEMWRSAGLASQYVTEAWEAGDAVVVFDGLHPMALELSTGERRWESDRSVGEGQATMLDVAGAPTLLLTEQHDTSEDPVRIHSSEIDVATGEITDFDAVLRAADLGDGYLISSTGQTQIVVPFED